MQRYLEDRGHNVRLQTYQDVKQGIPTEVSVALIQYKDKLSLALAGKIPYFISYCRQNSLRSPECENHFSEASGHRSYRDRYGMCFRSYEQVYPQLNIPAKSRQLFSWIEKKTPPTSPRPASANKDQAQELPNPTPQARILLAEGRVHVLF